MDCQFMAKIARPAYFAPPGILFFLAFVAELSFAQVTPTQKCLRIHRGILGSDPASQTELDSCKAALAQGREATKTYALGLTNNPIFLNTTIRYLVSPIGSLTYDNWDEFNDLIATIVGFAKDNVDASQLLSADIQYTCEGEQGLPGFANDNNDHYAACGAVGTNLATALQQRKQTDIKPALETGGVLTTRRWARSYYLNGTNRRPIPAILQNFLCEPLEDFRDNTRSGEFVRQDVSPEKPFDTYCSRCHYGMDALANAFCNVDYGEDGEGESILFSNSVVNKCNRAPVHNGYVVSNTYWKNQWATVIEGVPNPNDRVAWGQPQEGTGIASFGQMIGTSGQYARCWAMKVYKRVCKDPSQVLHLEHEDVKTIAASFAAGGFKIKELYSEAAATCVED